MKGFRLISIVISIITFGCDQIVDYQLPPEHPIPVVNAFITPDSVFKMRVTGSRHVLDNNFEFKPFPAEEVLVYKDNELIGQAFKAADGEFIIEDHYPEQGSIYHLQVDKSGYPSVVATDQVPVSKPEFKIESYRLVEEDYFISHSIDLRISNPAELTYFEVIVFGTEYKYRRNYPDPPVLTDSVYRPLYIYTNDPIADDAAHEYAHESIYFRNDLVKREDFNLEIIISYVPFEPWFDNNDPEPSDIDVVVRHISESYYNYMRSIRLHQLTQGDPLAEPVQVFCNIENGLGIFGSYTQNTQPYLVPYPD